MRSRTMNFAFLMVTIGVASQYAHAANLSVNCDKHESIRKALHLVAISNSKWLSTITVSGACEENLVIQGMDRMTMITKTGASITDGSGGTLAVVDIEDSRSVTVKGFTINGGAKGILCNTASVCYLTGNTIQGPGRFGVDVESGSHAFLESNVIQNWARGAFIFGSAEVFSSNDVFQSNGGSAIAVLNHSYFQSSNSSLNNNGVGIEAGGSGVFLGGGTVSGNTFDGVKVLAASEAIFSGSTITANGGVGVQVMDSSFVAFLLAASVTGNLSGLDVDCEPQFPTARFVASTGGVTNCVEPTSKSPLKDFR